jgi:hypothetical protein
MKTAGKCLLTAIIALLLQSCTIAYLDVRNNLNPSIPAERSKSCNVKYSISVSGIVDSYSSFGALDYDNELRKFKNNYNESTKEIFSKLGCIANVVDKEGDANFKIKVVRFFDKSTLAQDYLTGLSFGLIPSWGTKEAQYRYTFEDVTKNKIHTYSVDEHDFSHIILFPVFWISFITMDEYKVYKEALTNFIEGS